MSSNLTIDREEICDVIYWDDLTEAEQVEFDYLDTDEMREVASFARYRDWTYDLGEFIFVDKYSLFPSHWQGYTSDSFFSGVLVKYEDDHDDTVIMATYYS